MRHPSGSRYKIETLPKEILWFSQMFGGFPIKYAIDANGNRRLKFSPLVFSWGVIVVIVQSVVLMMWLGMIYKEAFSGLKVEVVSNTTLLVVTLDVLSLTLMILVVFASYLRKFKTFIAVCELLEKVDESLQQKMYGFRTRLRVLIIFLFTVIILTYSAITEYKRPLFQEIKLLEVFRSVISHIPIVNVYCTQSALFVHFTYITNTIAKRFKINNARIKQEVTRRCLINQCLPSEETKSSPLDDSSKCELKVLVDNYWLLCDAVHLANDFYCDQLLVTVLSSFCHITIALYYLIVHITTGDSMYITNDGAWVLFHILHLILLIRPSTEVTESAEATAPTVCKLINMCTDSTLTRQLESFLLQLPNHNARFCALGFFDLNNETLTSMAGVVTTYVVILFQFQSQNQTL
ncbi:uncharacterized protein LOC124370040 [Homalodisca vitripennis]|uniref:uncharacterized protein LOC124370040 n=1 Tax=Homalodisca vitripennis TaxID=197043 RepID=UPI001EECAF2D|nr:uncharacterized protein LOC124370040 [Homalodisca vitripennis]